MTDGGLTKRLIWKINIFGWEGGFGCVYNAEFFKEYSRTTDHIAECYIPLESVGYQLGYNIKMGYYFDMWYRHDEVFHCKEWVRDGHKAVLLVYLCKFKANFFLNRSSQ